MASYFKFKLQPGFAVGGNATWGGYIEIPFDGGQVKIKSHDASLDFYFKKPGMQGVSRYFGNSVPGAIEPGSEIIDYSDDACYSASQHGDDSPGDMLAKITAFRAQWFSLEKMNAGMLMVNTNNQSTYSVGAANKGGCIVLNKDVWTTYSVMSEQHPYLAFQMTLVNE